MPFEIDNITTHNQPHSEGISNGFQPTQWIFPSVPPHEFSPETLLVVRYSVLFRSLFGIDPYTLKIKSLDAHGTKLPDGFPMKQMHCP
jgi:hypothetical protein